MKTKFYVRLSVVLLLVWSSVFTTAEGKVVPGNNDSALTAGYIKPIDTKYYLLRNKDSIRKLKSEYTEQQMDVLTDVNRTDIEHIVTMVRILVPVDLTGAVDQYSPFPQSIPYPSIKKIILFSYLAEYFAAYENGHLVRSGPTNMGRRKDPTFTGLFFTNWKAEDTKSTFNDEWDMKWNFNIMNKEGVGFHQYSLPGFPASHSCLRLQESDAKFLYAWATEWKLKGKEDIIAKGTPVVIFGSYPFGKPKPWMQLLKYPHILDVSEVKIRQLIDPDLDGILKAQSITDKFTSAK